MAIEEFKHAGKIPPGDASPTIALSLHPHLHIPQLRTICDTNFCAENGCIKYSSLAASKNVSKCNVMLPLESVLSCENKRRIFFWLMVRKWIAHDMWSCCRTFICQFSCGGKSRILDDLQDLRDKEACC